MDRSDRDYIVCCKRLIEEKLQFGNEHGEVRQRDLEYLADNIEERSGIRLSLSTLKRLWKSDYDKMPHPSTLQALVSVLGYTNWQEFKLQVAAAPTSAEVPAVIKTEPIEVPEAPVTPETSAAPAVSKTFPVEPKHKRSIPFKPWLLLPIITAVAVVCWLIAFRK